jgi:manganese-dependent inorganic pyrophosphatase
MKTYVIGHKNPDTDSVVSTLALAALEGFVPARAGSFNKETEYVLNRFGFSTPEPLPKEEKKVVLVDTNGNPEELAEGISLEEITAIYDHHKLCGLKTIEPVTVLIEPVGATATIISDMFDLRDLTPKPEVASILISGIISDTLNFSSPTTSDRDRMAVENLNQIARLDVDKLAEEMFAAKSDISGMDTEELLTKDYKVFEMSGKKVGIGVWETVLPDKVLERKEDIAEALKLEKNKSGLGYAYFAIIDIIGQHAQIISGSGADSKKAESAFGGKAKDGILLVEGVVSRKKQIVPALEKEMGK